MADKTLQEIVDAFTARISERLDQSKLDGPIRLDPTRSVVILRLKGKGPIHVQTDHQINDQGADAVLHKIELVPSLKALVKS